MRTDTSRCQLSVDKRSLSAQDDLGKNATVEIVVAEPCSSVGYETGRRRVQKCVQLLRWLKIACEVPGFDL